VLLRVCELILSMCYSVWIYVSVSGGGSWVVVFGMWKVWWCLAAVCVLFFGLWCVSLSAAVVLRVYVFSVLSFGSVCVELWFSVGFSINVEVAGLAVCWSASVWSVGPGSDQASVSWAHVC
jgi:hypothetical protein